MENHNHFRRISTNFHTMLNRMLLNDVWKWDHLLSEFELISAHLQDQWAKWDSKRSFICKLTAHTFIWMRTYEGTNGTKRNESTRKGTKYELKLCTLWVHRQLTLFGTISQKSTNNVNYSVWQKECSQSQRERKKHKENKVEQIWRWKRLEAERRRGNRGREWERIAKEIYRIICN